MDSRNSFCPHHGHPPGSESAMTHYSIPSRLAEVDGVCREVRALLERRGVANRFFAVDLLLREFLNNAILHGNCSDARKRVQVMVRVGRKWIVLRIADEGPGFDWRSMRRVPPDENATSGRGLAIGALYAQRLRFNHAGNQVTSWIRKTESKETAS
jgi:anti-sigma regulatory factor (Ser/Thr protein kinase)